MDSAVCIKVGGMHNCQRFVEGSFSRFIHSDDRSGDIKAVRVEDDSSVDPTGPLKVTVSVLFEDGSIVLLKIRCQDGREAIVRDLVQFKEGEQDTLFRLEIRILSLIISVYRNRRVNRPTIRQLRVQPRPHEAILVSGRQHATHWYPVHGRVDLAARARRHFRRRGQLLPIRTSAPEK